MWNEWKNAAKTNKIPQRIELWRAVSEAERRNDCRSAGKNHAVQKRQQSKSMDGGSWQPHASVEIKHFEKQEHFL